MIGRLAAWFWRGLRTPPASAEVVDQEDEDAWLRCSLVRPSPHERLETGKAEHRAALCVVPDVEVADSPPTSASDGGWCPLCDDEIVAGGKVVHTTRDRWVHLSCLGGGQ